METRANMRNLFRNKDYKDVLTLLVKLQKQPPEVAEKKGVPRNLHISQENTCAGVSFLIQAFLVFSCEFCKISNNTFFTEHVWATASQIRRRSLNISKTRTTTINFRTLSKFLCLY